jgi:hypothetical protein
MVPFSTNNCMLVIKVSLFILYLVSEDLCNFKYCTVYLTLLFFSHYELNCVLFSGEARLSSGVEFKLN